MPRKQTVQEELRYEDLNEERKTFQSVVDKKSTTHFKYNIYIVIKIEKRTDGKNGFKDIFHVLDDLRKALPESERAALFCNDLNFRSTIKQTITYPKKWFNDIHLLEKYYYQLSKSLNLFLYNEEGTNRFIERDYRVIDYDVYITDVEANKVLPIDEIQELFN
ncbi:MAG: hypothetical protein LBV55_01690 [Acholeplasmatales bacterium]|nr:hypothetical protein [Acholeplasmatales bacterium]